MLLVFGMDWGFVVGLSPFPEPWLNHVIPSGCHGQTDLSSVPIVEEWKHLPWMICSFWSGGMI